MLDYFDHEQSDFVQVSTPPRRGYSVVSIFSGPKDDPARKFLMRYTRTKDGITDIAHRLHFDSGPYVWIEVEGSRRTYLYRGEGSKQREERFLPSGRLLVHDMLLGLYFGGIFTKEFDWDKMKPKGKPLGDRAVINLQQNEGEYFVSTYQYTQPDAVTQGTLRLVEVFQGHECKRIVEVE